MRASQGTFAHVRPLLLAGLLVLGGPLSAQVPRVFASPGDPWQAWARSLRRSVGGAREGELPVGGRPVPSAVDRVVLLGSSAVRTHPGSLAPAVAVAPVGGPRLPDAQASFLLPPLTARWAQLRSRVLPERRQWVVLGTRPEHVPPAPGARRLELRPGEAAAVTAERLHSQARSVLLPRGVLEPTPMREVARRLAERGVLVVTTDPAAEAHAAIALDWEATPLLARLQGFLEDREPRLGGEHRVAVRARVDVPRLARAGVTLPASALAAFDAITPEEAP